MTAQPLNIAQPLYDVLEATGYLDAGDPVPGVSLERDARNARRARNFQPDAVWRGQSSLKVYFKYERTVPSPAIVASPTEFEPARWTQ